MTKENKAVFTFFGASGDLAKRKLYPSLFKLYQKGYLKEHFAVIGTSRAKWSNDQFQGVVAESIKRIKEKKI